MKYLLKNGTVVSGTGVKKLDVLVEDEKIAKVEEGLSNPEAKVIDVTGKLLFPALLTDIPILTWKWQGLLQQMILRLEPGQLSLGELHW